MTDAELQAIEARRNAIRCDHWQMRFDYINGISYATWASHVEPSVTFHAPDYVDEDDLPNVETDQFGYYVPSEIHGPPNHKLTDARFMAHAPQDIAMLLAEIHRYRGFCRRLLAAHDEGTESVYAVVEDVREALREPAS